jgi:hypothetical protein
MSRKGGRFLRSGNAEGREEQDSSWREEEEQ